MAEETTFELETISDSQSGLLGIKGGYIEALERARAILEGRQVFVIQNDADKKKAKEIRAALNKVAKDITRRRIDTIEEFTIDFNTQCKTIAALFEERAKEFGEVINAYEDSQKLVTTDIPTTTKKFTATIKFTDEKVKEKLVKFCEKNGCELSIK